MATSGPLGRSCTDQGQREAPNGGVLPPGAYVWFMVVDADANGVLDGTFFDYVVTTITP